MSLVKPLAVFSVLLSSLLACAPEQPVLTMGNNESSVTFSFVSQSPCDAPTVQLKNLGDGSVQVVQQSDSSSYKDDPQLPGYVRYAYFFTTTVSNETKYSWLTDADDNKSVLGPFNFWLRDVSKRAAVRLALIGDMDLTDFSKDTRVALMNMNWADYDGFMHEGDYAYDIQNDAGTRGDKFFNTMMPVITNVPYLAIAGNHEVYKMGTLFNYRFRMPNYKPEWNNNFWYTTRGNVFIAFMTYDWLLTYTKSQAGLLEMVRIMDEILSKSADFTWKVVVSHRALYCGQLDRSDCKRNFLQFKPLEALYRKHKVDLLLSGHEHYYERLSLLDDQFTVQNVPYTKYTNEGVQINKPPHPVQIMSGCAGNREIDRTDIDLKPTTIRTKFIGFTACYNDLVFNATHFVFKNIAAANGTVLDQVVLSKVDDPNPDPAPEKSDELKKAILFGLIIIGGGLLSLAIYCKLRTTKQDGYDPTNTTMYTAEDTQVFKNPSTYTIPAKGSADDDDQVPA